jgi:uncharacterized RDD family membrane protein YckC
MATNYGPPVDYAGFWARVAAYFVDVSILIVLFVAISIGSAYAGDMGKVIGNIVYLLINLLYWPVMESSARQATFGKSIVGIQITDLNGNRVSFIRAFLRNLAKIISAIPLGIGFLLAAFTGRKQALHDMITKTLVVRIVPSSFIRTLAATIGALVISVGAFFYYMVLPKLQIENGGSMQEAMKSAMNSLPEKPTASKGLPPAPAAAPKPPVAAPASPVASTPVATPAIPQPAPAAPQPVITTAAPEPVTEPVKPASGTRKSASKTSKAVTMPEPMDSTSEAPEKLRDISRSTPAALSEPAPTTFFAPDSESRVIKPKYNDVMTAVLRGDGDAVKQLLDLGWWVDKPNSDGFTPLMAAITNRDTQMVQLLLDHGAVPSSQALKLAREKKDAATASLLEQRGAR